MTRTGAWLALLFGATITVAGCGSSGSGGASKPATSAPSASTSTTQPGSSAAVALAARMRSSLTGLTSAHVDVDAGQLGGKSSGEFLYAKGISTASAITLDSGAEKTRIITVGSTSYAKLPPGRNTSGKPCSSR